MWGVFSEVLGLCTAPHILGHQGRPWFQKFNWSSYHLQGLLACIILLQERVCVCVCVVCVCVCVCV